MLRIMCFVNCLKGTDQVIIYQKIKLLIIDVAIMKKKSQSVFRALPLQPKLRFNRATGVNTIHQERDDHTIAHFSSVALTL